MPDQQVQSLPEHVTLPLLTLITQQSLDEEYQHVAERRAAGDPTQSRAKPHRVAAVVVAIFGILVATAAVQTSRNAGVDATGRETLISQVNERRDALAGLQDQLAGLRDGNAELDDRLGQVTTSGQAALSRTRRLQAGTGFVAVTGPGVRIVVDDAPNGDETQMVRDEDLAKLVDGLWNAGAEAISINGQRLTVLSSIRNVGPAIHVNSRPLVAPYTVLAIGNTQSLQADLLDTTHGQEFFDLAYQLGFEFDMQNEDALVLPAARLRKLRSVKIGTAADNQGKHTKEESTP